MSRVGKQILNIPEKVEVQIVPIVSEVGGTQMTIKGPLGTIVKNFGPEITFVTENKTVRCEPVATNPQTNRLWGTYASHVENMLTGVSKGYEKKLVIEGIGYRAELAGTNLNFTLGFSHPVKIAVPKEVKAKVEKNVITLQSYDKDILGQFASFIVSQKPPEPYKGKGILYEGQQIRRKQGKRSTA